MRRMALVSAVVVTNRPLDAIMETVGAVLNDPGVIEVLLVVDGPGAATLGPVLDALDAATPRLRVLRLTSARGAESARRVGAEAALGELVWHLDDDVVPKPGCGRGHALAQHETGADIILGDMPTDLSIPSPAAALYEMARASEWHRFANDPDLILFGFWSGNFSILRRAQLDLPEIDPIFRWSYHADRAFGLECRRKGLRAVVRTEIEARHKYRRDLDKWRLDCRRQGAGTEAIHELYGDLVGPMTPDRWSAGLDRSSRTAIALSRVQPLGAVVTGGLTMAIRLAGRAGRHDRAVLLARTLRSCEQQRGSARAYRSRLQAAVRAASNSAIEASIVPADVSLLIVSAGPPGRLRAVLAQWRPHVAEIVVVCDAGTDPGLVDAIGDLADRTASVSTGFPVEAVMSRAWTLCSRSFVFRADDDHVPGETLLAELRSLTLDGSLDQAGLSVRWSWPDRSRYIDAYPWTANPQPLMIRNRPGLVRFSAEAHVTEQLDGPQRAIAGALYHLRTLAPVDERRAYAYRYVETIRPHLDGTPANREYLPEDCAPATLAVPPWDLPRLDAVLATDGRRRPRSSTGAEPVASQHLDAAPPRLRDGGRGASLQLRRRIGSVPTNAHLILDLVVANGSADVLPGRASGGPLLSVATRWTPVDGDGEIVEGARLALGEAIPPGRATQVVLATPVPVGPGRWRVGVDLVEEHVRWFEAGDDMEVDVTAPVGGTGSAS